MKGWLGVEREVVEGFETWVTLAPLVACAPLLPTVHPTPPSLF